MKMKKTPQQMLNTLKIPVYKDDAIVSSIPTDTSNEKIELFNVVKYITNSELIKEYESRGLVPAHPYDLMTAYRDEQPQDFIATVWDFKDGNISYLAFRRWSDDERRVHVNRCNGRDWFDGWWFAGLRKSSKLGASELKPLDPLSLELRIESLESDMAKIKKFLIM